MSDCVDVFFDILRSIVLNVYEVRLMIIAFVNSIVIWYVVLHIAMCQKCVCLTFGLNYFCVIFSLLKC